MFNTSEFGKRTKTAITGIAWIGMPVQVVAHLMAVIRSQVNTDAPTLFHFEHGFHHLINGDVSLQEIGLVEVSLFITSG